MGTNRITELPAPQDTPLCQHKMCQALILCETQHSCSGKTKLVLIDDPLMILKNLGHFFFQNFVPSYAHKKPYPWISIY